MRELKFPVVAHHRMIVNAAARNDAEMERFDERLKFVPGEWMRQK